MESIMDQYRKPDVTFNKSGRIEITAKVANILNLLPGDCIDVGIVNNIDYYLYVRRRNNNKLPFRFSARVYPTKKNTRSYRANCVELCRKILKMFHADSKFSPQLGSPILLEGDTAIPIIGNINLSQNGETN